MDRNGPAPEPPNRRPEPTGRSARPAESYFHSLPGSERSSLNARPSLSSSVVVQGLLAKIGSVAGPVA
jgi:hypothetical protein